jgi:hypothetical protein
MTRKSKRNSPSGNNGKASSPRRGEKTKQTKVAQGKETEPKSARQTKLAFAATNTPENTKETTKIAINDKETWTTVKKNKISFAPVATGTPTNPKTPTPETITTETETGTPLNPKNLRTAFKSTAITPEVNNVAKRLTHPSPPSTPERHTTETQKTEENNKKNKDSPGSTDDEKSKKPAATKATKKPPNKQDKPIKPPSSNDNGSYNSPTKYRAIRYNGLIETPPSEKPFDEFLQLLAAYFKIIQDVLGKDIFIAAWDSEQDKAFPPIRKPSKLPSSRESLGIYFGTYVNPRADGSKIYLNLRLVTLKPHHVPLTKFGMELSEHFSRSKHRLSMNRQPRPCQAAKTECIGWMMYSSKTINSASFIPAIKKTLKIPEEVEIGIQYRAIAMENGKKPPYNKEDPSAAAIHLDIDERYALVYQARAASLWRKNSKKRLPNGVQLRLVPCFSSNTGRSMTDNQRSDAKTLAERQYYFVKEHLKTLPPYYFISQLDTPLSDENSLTLRRAMMAQAPSKQPSSRLIHNVDIGWGQTTKYTITTVIGREQEASRFLSNMIPEYLNRFGEEATKWFSSPGLIVYKDVKWNPEKGTTTSKNEHVSEAMVKEDLWGLNEKWEEIRSTKNTDDDNARPDENKLDGNNTAESDIPEVTATSRLGSDKSIASFGNVYNRQKDTDDTREEAILAKEAAERVIDITGTQFEFNPEQLERDRQKELDGPKSTGFSMSTAAKTTDSTRLKLKEAQDEIGELRLALAKQKLTSLQESSIDTPEATPESQKNEENEPTKERKARNRSEKDHKSEAEQLGKDLIEHITDSQIIGAALAKRHREQLRDDPDAMEEDEPPPSTVQSLSSLDTKDDSDKTDKLDSDDEMDEDRSMIEISSSKSSSTGSSSDSSSNSSATSTSNDDTSNNDSEDEESSDSVATQELVTRLKTNLPKGKTNETQPTKNKVHIDEEIGATKSTAPRQNSGTTSGSRRDHHPASEPYGIAGDPIEDAGHGA